MLLRESLVVRVLLCIRVRAKVLASRRTSKEAARRPANPICERVSSHLSVSGASPDRQLAN